MSDSSPLRTHTGRFIDPQGRQVILHGINLVNKDPKAGYLGPADLKTFASFRRWGLNCVRLGVIWDGLEPEPGVFNETYCKGLTGRSPGQRPTTCTCSWICTRTYTVCSMPMGRPSGPRSRGANHTPNWQRVVRCLLHQPGSTNRPG